MMKHLAGGWERTFTRRSAAVLSGLTRNSSKLLHTFHGDVAKRAAMTGLGIVGVSTLESQLQNYENIFSDLSLAAKKTLDMEQRDINRDFTPTVTTAMLDAYAGCVEEHGSGSFARMKALMERHVEIKRDVMFRQSCENIGERLKQLLSTVREQMETACDEIFVAINRDYKSALGGGDLQDGEVMPKWQRDMRRAVLCDLEGVEQILDSTSDSEFMKREGSVESHGSVDNLGISLKEEDMEARDSLSPASMRGLVSFDGAAADNMTQAESGTIDRSTEHENISLGAQSRASVKAEDGTEQLSADNEGLQDKLFASANTPVKNEHGREEPEDSGVGFTSVTDVADTE